MGRKRTVKKPKQRYKVYDFWKGKYRYFDSREKAESFRRKQDKTVLGFSVIPVG